MSTLSVCMIVKDEAAHLAHCLESLGDLPQEIIVCDTGSTDDTVAIATQRGAQVHRIDWPNNFATARNQSLGYATGDWVLVIDADEALTAAGRQQIQARLTDQPVQVQDGPTIAAEQLLLITWLRQELGTRQSPYTQVTRLFRNHPKIRFDRPYHETIDDSAVTLMQAEPHWQIAPLNPVALSHTGYSDAAIANRDKFQRAEQLMTQHLSTHPQDAFLCNKLGALYGAQGDWAKGLTYLEQGLAQTLDPMTQYELHYHAGLANRALNRPQQAENQYQLALATPVDARLKLGTYLNLGSLYKHQQQLEKAIELLETATQIDPTQPLTYYNLGVTQRARGYLEPALAAYQQAIELNPNYAEAHQNRAAVLFKLGKLPESRRAFLTAIELYQSTNPATALRLQQGMHQLGLGQP
ncbi:MAG: tetratricopeptide repeat protein [Cyanobacteria bacterium J06632_22]